MWSTDIQRINDGYEMQSRAKKYKKQNKNEMKKKESIMNTRSCAIFSYRRISFDDLNRICLSDPFPFRWPPDGKRAGSINALTPRANTSVFLCVLSLVVTFLACVSLFVVVCLLFGWFSRVFFNRVKSVCAFLTLRERSVCYNFSFQITSPFLSCFFTFLLLLILFLLPFPLLFTEIITVTRPTPEQKIFFLFYYSKGGSQRWQYWVDERILGSRINADARINHRIIPDCWKNAGPDMCLTNWCVKNGLM